MLKKSSVFMMLLITTASLVGISSIHYYAEGQTPVSRVVGNVLQVTTYAPVVGCMAVVSLPATEPNDRGVKPGEPIFLFSERESTCVLLGMSKMTNYGVVAFEAQKMTVSGLPAVIRADVKLPASTPNLFRMFNVDVS
jgi:hypothetical protein